MRRREIDSNLDGLAEIWRESSEPAHRASIRRRVGAVMGAALTLSVAAACMVMPPTLAAASVTESVLTYWDEMPTELPTDQPMPLYTRLVDKDGKQFAQFFSENRVPVSLDQVSPFVIDALMATEDSRFMEHGGVDVRGILRAAVHNAVSDTTQGGSTLTQQLVENLLLVHADSREEVVAAKASSLMGKVQEARYAVALEEEFSKEEILEMYLNTVYLGSGAYGIGTASHRYFGVSPSELTLEQAATIVGLLKSPLQYDPLKDPEAAQGRRDVVLGRMLTTGVITQEQHDEAVATPLTTTPETFANGCHDSAYPFYCAYVLETILNDPDFGETREERESRLALGGITIHTALDPVAMQSVEDAIAAALDDGNRVAAGVAVVQPGTGYVVAIGQNREWGQGDGQTEIVYADSRFQPGSSFKAITLATAFEQGLSPNIRISAPRRYTPSGLSAPSGGFRNSPDRGYGVLDARAATRASANTWFVGLVERVGVLETADMAARLGINGIPRSGDRALTGREASLTLGAYEATPLEMATAYATFASGGIKCDPTPVVRVTDSQTGEDLIPAETDCTRELMPGVAATVADVLTEPLKPGGTADKVDIGRPAAGKTGTTNSFAATWFVGFTPQYSTAVWIGDPRGGQAHPLVGVRAYGRYYPEVYGGDIAAPLWGDVMERIHEGLPVRQIAQPSAAVSALRGVTVPDYRSMTVGAAAEAALDEGMTVMVAPETSGSASLPAGIVVAHSSSGGVVTLTLSPGSDPSILGTEIVRADDGSLRVVSEGTSR